MGICGFNEKPTVTKSNSYEINYEQKVCKNYTVGRLDEKKTQRNCLPWLAASFSDIGLEERVNGNGDPGKNVTSQAGQKLLQLNSCQHELDV